MKGKHSTPGYGTVPRGSKYRIYREVDADSSNLPGADNSRIAKLQGAHDLIGRSLLKIVNKKTHVTFGRGDLLRQAGPYCMISTNFSAVKYLYRTPSPHWNLRLDFANDLLLAFLLLPCRSFSLT